jgi:hypothetical protein
MALAGSEQRLCLFEAAGMHSSGLLPAAPVLSTGLLMTTPRVR